MEFEKLAADITKALLEMKKINKKLIEENEALAKENQLLREKLRISSRKENNGIKLDEAFDRFRITGSNGNQIKSRVYNSYCVGENKFVEEFKNKSAYELFLVNRTGYTSCAIFIIVLEHFGVKIEIPDTDCKHSMSYYAQVKLIGKANYSSILQLKTKIDEWRPRIYFYE